MPDVVVVKEVQEDAVAVVLPGLGRCFLGRKRESCLGRAHPGRTRPACGCPWPSCGPCQARAHRPPNSPLPSSPTAKNGLFVTDFSRRMLASAPAPIGNSGLTCSPEPYRQATQPSAPPRTGAKTVCRDLQHSGSSLLAITLPY